MDWFKLTGTNPTSALDYILVEEAPEDCGETEEIVCAIQATKGPNDKPILDIAILSEIILALTKPENKPNVLLKERPL